MSSTSNSQITDYIKESKDLFIPFQVIKEATKSFTTVLGRGGYGVVYKGELLLSGQLTSVAVKRLDSTSISGQGFKEFLTEIQLLSRYKHPNLVSLLGFCDEAGEKILIYEYAEHGSLDQHLPVAKTTRALTWEQRISVCLDTARGLNYLHHRIAKNHRVIHRDIKSANILIGHDWKAMISDLGLSKIGRSNESDSYLITHVSGTPGYCDPEYMHTGILTKESDVYSFGVVMFEVFCGRLGFMNVNNQHRFLAPLAKSYYEIGRLNDIIDPYLKIKADSDSLKRFSEIAHLCLLNERDRRPSMGFVVQKLDEMMASLKLVAQGSSKDPSSSKSIHCRKKGDFLRRYIYGNANKAYSVLGRKTYNIRDIYTFGKKLEDVEHGTIYLCTEISTGIDYACKIISKSKLISKTHLKEVRREIQIMRHLAGYNNIVTIKGAYEDLSYVYIVMELCTGGKFFDRIVQIGHYTEKKAAELIKVIAGVVQACHSLGVIHRNLKPENFLLVNRYDDFSLKATDFSSSVFCKPGKIYKDIVGTAYYVAPEVIQRRHGPEADVWSVGVILYILLSGEPPFWAEKEKGILDQVLKRHVNFDSAPWPHISDNAKDLIRKMLCSRPSDRLTAYAVLSHPWLCENGVAPERLDPAILSRLKQFSTMNTLKKMAFRVVAERLFEDEIVGLRKMFKLINTDNSGAITFNELKASLRNYGSTLEDIKIRDLMDALTSRLLLRLNFGCLLSFSISNSPVFSDQNPVLFKADMDNNGTIDYGEFLAATIHVNKIEEEEEHLVGAFHYFDKDESGYITVDDLQKACAEFNMTVFVAEDIIREVDQDNDGRIGYGEFVEMMKKGNAGVRRRKMQNS